jgi:glycosyltransferase involved in cell wall biosynthesis
MHVTVCIPVYNREDLVAETLQIVLDQSHKDLDVLVLDDGSSDGSVAVISRFLGDGRIRLVRHDRNWGLVATWNHALELARGPLVLMLASDDLIDLTYLEEAAGAFASDPELGLVYAPVRHIDVHGNVVGGEQARVRTRRHAGDAAIGHLLDTGVCTVTQIFKKELAERLGPYRVDLWHGPDVEFATRLAAHAAILDLGQVRGSFRKHDGQQGPRNFLRRGIVQNYVLQTKLIYGQMSPEGRRKRGISDLVGYAQSVGAKFGCQGSSLLSRWGYRREAIRMLAEAVRLDSSILYKKVFFKAMAAFLLGRRLLAIADSLKGAPRKK